MSDPDPFFFIGACGRFWIEQKLENALQETDSFIDSQVDRNAGGGTPGSASCPVTKLRRRYGDTIKNIGRGI